MARLVGLKDRYRVAVRERPRRRPARHRHAVGGAHEPEPLPRRRDPTILADASTADWPAQRGGRQDARVEQHDRPRRARDLGRRLCEVPVGFKWFVAGLFDGSCCFGGEESAGASFLRRDGTVWTTDKDGLIMNLLAAEITARTGRDPGEHYRDARGEVRRAALHAHRRAGDARAEGAARERCRPTPSRASALAGEPITAKLTAAPGNGAPIGGLKVTTAQRLVRGAAVGHREHLQDLRRELRRRRAPRRDRARGAGDRERGADGEVTS